MMKLGIGRCFAECERVEVGIIVSWFSVGDKYRLGDLLQISAGLVSDLAHTAIAAKVGLRLPRK